MEDRGGISRQIPSGILQGISLGLTLVIALKIALIAGGSQVSRAESEHGERLKCRAFPTEPSAEIDTRDPESDLGRWVLDHEDRGWRVHGVQWDIGQKPTGYPQGWVQICLTPL